MAQIREQWLLLVNTCMKFGDSSMHFDHYSGLMGSFSPPLDCFFPHLLCFFFLPVWLLLLSKASFWQLFVISTIQIKFFHFLKNLTLVGKSLTFSHTRKQCFALDVNYLYELACIFALTVYYLVFMCCVPSIYGSWAWRVMNMIGQ